MRRSVLIGALAAGFLPVLALAAIGPRVVLPVQPLESAVIADMNAIRVAHGLRPLRPSGALASSADQHSREMVDVGYFAHESADGSPFWARIKRFYDREQSRRWLVGENLLWAANSVSAREVVRAWMRSPSHRANVLRDDYREIGVSAVRAFAAPGVYARRRVVVLTVDFGLR